MGEQERVEVDTQAAAAAADAEPQRLSCEASTSGDVEDEEQLLKDLEEAIEARRLLAALRIAERLSAHLECAALGELPAALGADVSTRLDLEHVLEEAVAVRASLELLHDHRGFAQVSGKGGGPLQGWYRSCERGKVHWMKFAAPVGGVSAEQLVACVREFDLIPSWNSYCTAAEFVREHGCARAWCYGACWFPPPFPQPDSLLALRGWDLFQEEGCFALTVRTEPEHAVPPPPAATQQQQQQQGSSASSARSGGGQDGAAPAPAGGAGSGTSGDGGGDGGGSSSGSGGPGASSSSGGECGGGVSIPGRESRKRVDVRAATVLFKPLPPGPGGEPRTLGAVVAELDPHMPSVPQWLVEFVAKVMAPFLYKALQSTVTKAFSDGGSEYSARLAMRPLYRQVREAAAAVLQAQAQGRAYSVDTLVPSVAAAVAAAAGVHREGERLGKADAEVGALAGWFGGLFGQRAQAG